MPPFLGKPAFRDDVKALVNVVDDCHCQHPAHLLLLAVLQPRRRAEGEHDGYRGGNGGECHFLYRPCELLFAPQLGHPEFCVHNGC